MALYADSPAPRRSGLASFWMLPCPPFGEEARRRWMSGGISSFQFSESFNAEVQTFLVPETCYKACNLTAGRLAGWWILPAVLRVCIWWGCCLMLEFQTQTVGENTNVWALTLLLFSHSWSGEAPLLPALISSFVLDLLLFLFEETLGPKINWGPCVQLAERGTMA